MSVFNNKPIGFLTFGAWHGKEHIGSSRIRAQWLINNWPMAELFQQGAKYDVIIFQKTYWLDYVKEFKGIKILDLADPDWLEGLPIKGIIDNCDAVTTSTEALAVDIRRFTDKPVLCIPDRVDLNVHPFIKKHKDNMGWACWFGYSHNAKTLDVAIPTLTRHKIKLKVISDSRPPYAKADQNVKYDWNNPAFDFNREVIECDFVLMPKDERAKGKFKSNNKTITSWALGMPVATNPQEVKRFLNIEERKKEADIRIKEVRELWDVKSSIIEMKNLIKELEDGKNKG